jgi:hypothetical protein
MNLDLNGLESRQKVTNRSKFTSQSTGSELDRLTVDIVVSGDKSNDKLLDIITKGREKGLNSIDKQHNLEKQWKIVNDSWSYGITEETAAITDYFHTLELEELEVLKLETLKIGDLKLQPYVYSEKFVDKYLIIDPASVMVTRGDVAQLKGMILKDAYYPVVRTGINPEPREMRFGKVLWSEHENNIKFKLILVEKGYDELVKFPALNEPELSNLMQIVAENSEKLKELLAVLNSKGFLHSRDIQPINLKSKANAWKTLQLFTRVNDIDNW